MGVKSLWSILECCGEKVDLRDLRNKTIAIDLAGWVVQNNQCKAMSGRVAKPHLRNVFFRTTCLITNGIRPIFVMDGAAPELKMETLAARKAVENGSDNLEVKSLSRNRLKAVMSECKFLLSTMGIRCVQAKGEGEALCALLNAEGSVDAVISEDSDIFIYGAKTVLRNFSVSSHNVESYSGGKVESSLGLSRDRLIFMAVFLGCDFFPTGIPGVGKEGILNLYSGWKKSWDALKVLNFWIKTSFKLQNNGECAECECSSDHCSLCSLWSDTISHCGSSCLCVFYKNAAKSFIKAENAIKKKCLAIGLEWWNVDYPKIVNEYIATEPIPDITDYLDRNCPKVSQCMSILVKKLSWTEDYARERLLPILTRWQLEHLVKGGNFEVIVPEKIVKKRVVNNVRSLVIEWKINDCHDTDVVKEIPEKFETVEEMDLMASAFPDLCEPYMNSVKAKKQCSSKAAKPKKKCAQENISTQKPITQFFQQRKVSSWDNYRKEKKRVDPTIPEESIVASQVQNEPVLDGSSFQDSDCSDLSDIIDDFLSQKITNMTVEMEEEVSESETEVKIVTSTPANTMKKKKKQDSLRHLLLDPMSAKPEHKNHSNPVSAFTVGENKENCRDIDMKSHENSFDCENRTVDMSEDSFDRMCK